MTESMITRVAKAIYHGTPRNKPFEQLQPPHRRYWEKRAIAAVRALREPTADMRRAFWDAEDATDSGFRRAWNAALEKALSDTEQGG
jgi:hypothetical protein